MYLVIFTEGPSQNLKSFFHLILVGIPSSLILTIKNRWVESVKHDKSFLSTVSNFESVDTCLGTVNK